MTIILNGTTGITTPGPSVVEADSSDAALRITQTGSGNALVVEDSTNPDATPFVVNADGRALTYGNQIGYVQTSALAPYATSIATTGLINWSGNSGSAQLALGQQVTSATPPIAAFYKARGGLTDTPTIVSSGDATGSLRIHGYDGTNFIESARIESYVDGTPGTNDMPGRLVFSTTADGASSVTERMRITSDGYVRLSSNALGIQFGGDTSADNALNDYEFGTWTPEGADAATGGNTAGGSFYGTYTKIGRQVTIWCGVVNIDTTGMTGANDLYIRNLPFTASNLTGTQRATGALVAAQITTSAMQVSAEMLDNTSYVRFNETLGTDANFDFLLVSEISSGTGDLYFSLSYVTD